MVYEVAGRETGKEAGWQRGGRETGQVGWKEGDWLGGRQVAEWARERDAAGRGVTAKALV